MNHRRSCIVFALAFVANIADGREVNRPTGRIIMSVSRVAHERELVVEITNASKETIHLTEDRLPWKWRYAMIIKAFRADATGTSIEEAFGISDPFPRPVTLKPGQRLS